MKTKTLIYLLVLMICINTVISSDDTNLTEPPIDSDSSSAADDGLVQPLPDPDSSSDDANQDITPVLNDSITDPIENLTECNESIQDDLNTSMNSTLPDDPTSQPEYQEESVIQILETYPETISFGDIVNLTIQIYKGNTSKYVVKAYVEGISNISKVNIHQKFSNQTYGFSIALDDNSGCAFKEGEYGLIVEGLDAYINKSVHIDAPGCMDSGLPEETNKTDGQAKTQPPAKLQFIISEFPESIEVNESFKTDVLFLGNQDSHVIEVFSYIYKSSKCYSGERESNKELFILSAWENKTITLENMLSDYAEGLKLKVKIKVDERKTYDEIIRDMAAIKPEPTPMIEEPKIETNKTKKAVKTAEPEEDGEEMEDSLKLLAKQKVFTGDEEIPISSEGEKQVVYRSKGVKSLDIALYCIICSLLGVLGLILFKKNT